MQMENIKVTTWFECVSELMYNFDDYNGDVVLSYIALGFPFFNDLVYLSNYASIQLN